MNYPAAYLLSAAIVAMIVIGAQSTAQPELCGNYNATTNIVTLCDGTMRQGVPQK